MTLQYNTLVEKTRYFLPEGPAEPSEKDPEGLGKDPGGPWRKTREGLGERPGRALEKDPGGPWRKTREGSFLQKIALPDPPTKNSILG
jgi:hypothetical protein